MGKNKVIIQDEYIYRFDSAEEAIVWLSYYLLNKRTEVILSNLITNLQREISDLKLRISNLESLSSIDNQLLNYLNEDFNNED